MVIFLGDHRRREKPSLWQHGDNSFLIILGIFILLGLLLDFTNYDGLITGEDAESSAGTKTNAATLLFGIPFWLIFGFNFKVATFKQSFFCLLVIVSILALFIYTIFDYVNFIF